MAVSRHARMMAAATASGRARSSACPGPGGSVSRVSVIGTRPTIPMSTSSASRIVRTTASVMAAFAIGVRSSGLWTSTTDTMPVGPRMAPSRSSVRSPNRTSSRVPAWSAIVTHSEPALLVAPSRRPRAGRPSRWANARTRSSKAAGVSAIVTPAARASSRPTVTSPAIAAVWLADALAPAVVRPAR